MHEMSELIGAIQLQVDLFLKLSTAGIGIIFFIWIRSFGFAETAPAFSKVKWVEFLALPLSFYLISFIFAYMIIASFNGFYTEVVLKVGAYSDSMSGAEYYKREYSNIVNVFNFIQIMCFACGIFLTSLWFFVNLLNIKGK